MPVFTLNTNVKDVPSDFHSKALDVLAKTLGKPKSYIAIHVNTGQNITFGGTSEPAALCDLGSIGQVSVSSNKKHSKAIMDLLGELGIKADRIYINFHNLDKAYVGYNGTTFDDLI